MSTQRLPTTDAKAAWRDRLRTARRQLPPAERLTADAANCAALGEVVGHGVAAAGYCAVGSEADPTAWYHQRWAEGVSIWLPRVVGSRSMVWHEVISGDQLRPGFRGITEPDPAQCPAAVLPGDAVIVLPGVGFTAAGARLGQGGGFYDQFLAERLDSITIGLALPGQVVSSLPHEPHDQSVSAVLVGGRWLPERPSGLSG